MKKIILASQSPRRKQLLEWAEIPFDVRVVETDESFPIALSVEEAAIHIARQKALAVKQSHSGSELILAADTIVVLNARIIGKPKNRAQAIEYLQSLSGQKHKVITGVCLLSSVNEKVFSDTTEVEFHNLTDEQVIYYVDQYKPFDKAGAYAIQEWIGVIGIKAVHGDFYNVMGLPVSRVVKELIKMDEVKDIIH
ncbi:MAG: septum formation protein Maf [Chitinophagaceae bacterium]|jgi:septum formation protein|nr:septum formation protein Maf [Chitinophagaceae bacterium]